MPMFMAAGAKAMECLLRVANRWFSVVHRIELDLPDIGDTEIPGLVTGITAANRLALRAQRVVAAGRICTQIGLEVITNTEFQLVVVRLFSPLGELIANRRGQSQPQVVDAVLVQLRRNRVAGIQQVVEQLETRREIKDVVELSPPGAQVRILAHRIGFGEWTLVDVFVEGQTGQQVRIAGVPGTVNANTRK